MRKRSPFVRPRFQRAGAALRPLSETEKTSVNGQGSGSARVVHEVVRLQGEEELNRALRSLLLSGFAADAINASGPDGNLAAPASAGHALARACDDTVGFVSVILAKLQLFTKSTVTAVLPVATRQSGRNRARLLRL